MDAATAATVVGSAAALVAMGVGGVAIIARDVTSKVINTTVKLGTQIDGLTTAVVDLKASVKEAEKVQRDHGEKLAALDVAVFNQKTVRAPSRARRKG